ncbi:MAG: RluA family pseudouridine synthase [Candidatus Makana argininalis]
MKLYKNKYKSISVPYERSYQRIDNFLINNIKKISKNLLYLYIRKGLILVNAKKVNQKYKINYNDIILIPKIILIQKNKKKTINKYIINILKRSIIFEDNCLIIINKPAKISVHGCINSNLGIIEYFRILRPKLNFLELVHRLDKETSGVLILAKKKSVLCNLHNQLKYKKVKKEYLTLVKGYWNKNIKYISQPLLKKRNLNNKHKVKINNLGKKSKTLFKIKERFKIATLLKVIPLTGRTHQIRVHALFAGHPIAFDNRYGDKNFDKKLKLCGLNSLFLHAKSMIFYHPINHKIINIKAKLNSKMKKCVIYLRSLKI